MTETTLMRRLMLAVSEWARVFRNNVGLAWRRDGAPVRFGLCKGSSDLIGWTPVTIDGNTVALTRCTSKAGIRYTCST